MKPDEIQAIASVVQTIIALATLVATALIARFVQQATQKLSAMEYSRELMNLWTSIDSIVLSDEQLLEIADVLVHPETGEESLEVRRKRWICYMLLNAMATTFDGMKNGFISRSASHSFDRTLQKMLVDDLFYSMVQTYAYEKNFKAYCKSLREQTLDSVKITKSH